MTRRKEPQPEAVAEPAVPDMTEPAKAPVEAIEAPLPEDAPEDHPLHVDAPPPPEPPPRGRQTGILGALLGGALAAIGGFALSHFNLLGLAPPDISTDLAALGAKVEEAATLQTGSLDKVTGELDDLATRIAALETAPAAAEPDLSRLDTMEDRLAAIEAMPADGAGSSAALAAKVAELERRLAALPATGPSPDLQQRLDEALARLDGAEAAAKARASEAEAAAAAALREQALDALTAAVAEGRPFASELQALDDSTVSSGLTALAETGVPTLAHLQADFPDAARRALGYARESGAEDGWSDRLVDFLAAQTGARSVTPRDGTSPDAILSRAEFALSEGRVIDALSELAALDPVVRAPLEDWTAAATAHVDANAALQAARGE
jgi:hypothetical protein